MTEHSVADPQLTPLGEEQAQAAHAAWKQERRFGIPLPEKLYTSPLTRAIRTHQVTFDDILSPSSPKTTIFEVRRSISLGGYEHTHDAYDVYSAYTRTQWRSYLRQAADALRHPRQIPRVRLRSGVHGGR